MLRTSLILATVSLAALANTNPSMPYLFEKNVGQAPGHVHYIARGGGHMLVLEDSGATMLLPKSKAQLGIALVGAEKPRKIEGAMATGGLSNYFLEKKSFSAPQYSRVNYLDAKPGVDMVFYSREGQLEYDLLVAPGVDPAKLEIEFRAASRLSINRAGGLDIEAGGKRFNQLPALAYQDVEGNSRVVDVRFELRGGNRVGFRVGSYDRARQLVIDPVLVYSSFYGGELFDTVNAVTVDASGSIYIAGETTSLTFPVVGGGYSKPTASTNAFIAKLDAEGKKVIYSSYLGGSSATRINAIQVDADGNVYVTGRTGARDFPLVNPVQSNLPGLNILFVSKLNAAGSKLLFSTLYGGERNDEARALALDKDGSIYLAGLSNSSNFPVVNAVQPKIAGSSDVVLVKFQAPDYRVAYATYIGHASQEEPFDLVVDQEGNAYVGGWSTTVGNSTSGVFQLKSTNGSEGFIFKVSADGRDMPFFLFFGASGEDRIRSLAFDYEGNLWFAGGTSSKNLKISEGAYQKEIKGIYDGFVGKTDRNAKELLYLSYFGGTSTGSTSFPSAFSEEIRSIAFDAHTTMYLAGVTNTIDFPVARELQKKHGAGNDNFLARFNFKMDQMIFSTYMGGEKDDALNGLAMDSAGSIYFGGQTNSAAYPIQKPFRGALVGSADGYFTKVCDPTLVVTQSPVFFEHVLDSPPPLKQTLRTHTCADVPYTVSAEGGLAKASPLGTKTNSEVDVAAIVEGLDEGDHEAKLVFTVPKAYNSPVTVPVGIRVTLPAPKLEAASEAAVLGQVFTLRGNYITGKASAVIEGETFPTDLSGTVLWLDGNPMPLVSVKRDEIRFAMPPEMLSAEGTPLEQVSIAVQYKEKLSNAVVVAVVAAPPTEN